MPVLGAPSDFPYEIILILVAAIIGIINKVVEASRSVRRKSIEETQKPERTTGVELEEIEIRGPAPEGAEDLPLPEFRMPIPMPERLAPKPAARRAVLPKPVIRRVEATRRPRPPKPRLQLGTQPAPTPPRSAAARRAAAPLRQRVVRAQPKIRVSLRDPARLREAVVLREVLGPPLALRGLRRR